MREGTGRKGVGRGKGMRQREREEKWQEAGEREHVEGPHGVQRRGGG